MAMERRFNIRKENIALNWQVIKIAGKMYIWQKASSEGVNLICFFVKKQIKFTPSEKIYLIYYLPDARFGKK